MNNTAKATYRIEGEDASAAAFASVIENAKGAAEKMSGLFEAAFAGISVAAVAEFTKSIIDSGDEIETAAKKAGVGGQAFSELAYAAKQSGIDMGTLSQAIAVMSKNLSLASTGAKEPTEALRALGLNIEYLKGLKPDQQFEVLAQQISKLTTPADKARAEMELLGRAGADLGPLFEQGGIGIEKARQEAERIGAAFSDETLKSLEEAHLSMDRLTTSFQGFAAMLVGNVAPAISTVLDRLSGAISGDKLQRLNQEIEFLQKVQGEGFFSLGLSTYQDIGSGYFSSDEGAKKLQDLISQRDALQGKGGPGQFFSDYDAMFKGFTSLPNPPGFDRGYDEQDYQDLLKMIGSPKLAADDDKTGPYAAFQRATGLFDLFDKQTRKASDEMGQHFNDAMTKPLKEIEVAHQHFWDELDAIGQDGARQMQSSFENFLIDPSVAGFKNMGIAFIQTIEKMAADAAATDLFGALFGRDKESSTGGLSSIFTSLLGGAFGLGGGSGYNPSTYLGGIGTTASPDYFSGLFPGHDSGADFMIGGRGGTDQNLVAFRGTRGEEVRVTPAGRQGNRGGGDSYNIVVNATVGDVASKSDVVSGMNQAMNGAVARLRDMKRRGSF